MNTRLLAAALLVLGLAQMTGKLVGSPVLSGLAAATAASPAPKVFSSARGLETFSTAFRLEWEAEDGTARVLRLTHDVYPRLRGPYNRRNVYGAVLAFGPVLVTEPLTHEMYQSVATYALCGDAPILRELGIEPDEVRGGVRVVYEPRRGAEPDNLPLVIEVCRDVDD